MPAAGDVRSIVLGARDADEARLHGRLSLQGVGVAGRLVFQHVQSGELRGSETDAGGNFDVALDPPGLWRIEARRSCGDASPATTRKRAR